MLFLMIKVHLLWFVWKMEMVDWEYLRSNGQKHMFALTFDLNDLWANSFLSWSWLLGEMKTKIIESFRRFQVQNHVTMMRGAATLTFDV